MVGGGRGRGDSSHANAETQKPQLSLLRCSLSLDVCVQPGMSLCYTGPFKFPVFSAPSNPSFSPQEKLSDQLEEQRQEQALQRYRCEADELDHWLLNTKATLDVALGTSQEPMDMDAQLVDCQVQRCSSDVVLSLWVETPSGVTHQISYPVYPLFTL